MGRPPTKTDRITSNIYATGYAECIDGRAHTRVGGVRRTTHIRWERKNFGLIRKELDKRIKAWLDPDSVREATPKPERTLLDLLEEYEREVLEGMTKVARRHYTNAFTKWLPLTLIAAVPLDYESIRSYLLERRNSPEVTLPTEGRRWKDRSRPIAYTTQREYLKKVRQLLAFGRLQGYLGADPSEGITIRRNQVEAVAQQKQSGGNAFTDTEMALLLKELHTMDEQSDSTGPLSVILLYLTGMRVHEIIGLSFARRDAGGSVTDLAGRLLGRNDGYVLIDDEGRPNGGIHIVGKGHERWLPLWVPRENDHSAVAEWQRELGAVLTRFYVASLRRRKRWGMVVPYTSLNPPEKTFLEARRATGLYDEKRSLHELRDTRGRIWKAHMRFPDHVVARLLGHSMKVHERHYNTSLPPDDLIGLVGGVVSEPGIGILYADSVQPHVGVS